MNPKYQEIKTNYKDDDVFYFFRKGFEKEVDLVKIKNNEDTVKRWSKATKKRKHVPEKALV